MTDGVLVVFGGRSEIGLATAVRLAAGRKVVLAVRGGAADEAVRTCQDAGATNVAVINFDADDTAGHAELVDSIEQRHGPIETAILAFGILGDQQRGEHDHHEVVRVLTTDFVAQASLLTVLTSRLREHGGGTVIAFSSVAGVRVRRANYVYGSAKAGLDGFASGLIDALHGGPVRVVLARPGFVIGRMSAGMRPAVFSRTADQVADAVADAVTKGHHGEVWIPWQLRMMFAVAPFVPRALWRRMPR